MNAYEIPVSFNYKGAALRFKARLNFQKDFFISTSYRHDAERHLKNDLTRIWDCRSVCFKPLDEGSTEVKLNGSIKHIEMEIIPNNHFEIPIYFRAIKSDKELTAKATVLLLNELHVNVEKWYKDNLPELRKKYFKNYCEQRLEELRPQREQLENMASILIESLGNAS